MPPEADIQLRAVLDASSALRGIDRARLAMVPARLVADLGGMVARWRLERGLSDEPASAIDIARMILSIEGIGQAIIDAYTTGAGVLVVTTETADPVLGVAPRRTFRAVKPDLKIEEAPDATAEQVEVGQDHGQAQAEPRRPD